MERLQLIIDRLALPPFRRRLTLQQLNGEGSVGLSFFQLIGIVHDIILQLEESNPQSIHRQIDLSSEGAENTINRILAYLRLMRYQPPEGIADLDMLRQPLLNGDRKPVFHLLHFQLQHFDQLKKRAYLAPYLQVVDISPDCVMDESIHGLKKRYEELQEEFRRTHKLYDQLRESKSTAVIIKSEIQQLEEEKVQLQSRIQRIQTKAVSMPHYEEYLSLARSIRIEQETQLNLQENEKKETEDNKALELQVQESQKKLGDIKQANIGLTAETMLQKLNEETRVNRYFAQEKLPATVQQKKRQISELRSLFSQQAYATTDIARLESQVKDLNRAISGLKEEKMKVQLPADDKIQVFRQQASLIAHKKESTAETLAELMRETALLAQEVQEKEERVQMLPKILTGEEFRAFAEDLRSKSTSYKERKQLLSQVTTEVGVLRRTQEILTNKITSMRQHLGLSEEENKVQDGSKQSREDLKQSILGIANEFQQRKPSVTQKVNQLRELKQIEREQEFEMSDKKKTYDAVMLSIEADNQALQRDIHRLEASLTQEQSRLQELESQMSQLKVDEERVLEEMKMYVGGEAQQADIQRKRGFKTYRDLYNRQIVELEAENKLLKEELQSVESKRKQQTYISQAKRFLELKMEIQRQNTILQSSAKSSMSRGTTDRLVL